MSTRPFGTLVLLPNRIAEGPPEASLPAGTLDQARRLHHFRAENAKSARAFLKAIGHPVPLAELDIQEIGHAPPPERLAEWLAPLASGTDVAVLSESGCPGVADPGASLVAAAHALGARVRPLVGPSSILLALMASGLEGQRFRFVGYVPIEAERQAGTLRALERDSARGETQIFIETPYRNRRLFEALLTHCAPRTRLAVAVDLTGPDEFIAMHRIGDWRARAAPGTPPFERRPAVFCLLA